MKWTFSRAFSWEGWGSDLSFKSCVQILWFLIPFMGVWECKLYLHVISLIQWLGQSIFLVGLLHFITHWMVMIWAYLDFIGRVSLYCAWFSLKNQTIITFLELPQDLFHFPLILNGFSQFPFPFSFEIFPTVQNFSRYILCPGFSLKTS